MRRPIKFCPRPPNCSCRLVDARLKKEETSKNFKNAIKAEKLLRTGPRIGDFGVREQKLEQLHNQSDEEEKVGEKVVKMPKREVTLEEASLVHRLRVLQFPEEVRGAHVPAGVGHDPDRGEDVDPVDGRRLRLGHVDDDEDEEDHVGERGVDAAVERHPPLLHEPRRRIL